MMTQDQLRRKSRCARLIEITDLTKVYGMGNVAVQALRGVNATVEQGEFVAIMGSSGSGKSTLMNILGCLDRPTSGTYILDGEDVSRLSKNQLASVRNKKDRLCLSIVQPAAPPYGGQERDAAHAVQRAQLASPTRNAPSAPSRCWNRWDWATGRTTGPTSFRAGSSSGSPSRAR